jgi:hypothetical protein
MKKVIYKDDRYPVFGLFNPEDGFCLPDRVVEIPQKLWDSYLWVNALYDEVQSELKKVYDAK